ncbi:MFS transporter [Enterococcus camelliae]|uniref:MFS transporter n=1 Tax=Enterococcus camelliae TaxID=453959 RepID=A0ABW5TJ56_9ENTE
MKKKIIPFLCLNVLVLFSTTLFQLNILWEVFKRQEELKSLVIIISSSFVLQAGMSLVVGIIVDFYSKRKIFFFSIWGFIITVSISYFVNINLQWAVFYLIFTAINTLFLRCLVSTAAEMMTTDEFMKYDGIAGLFNQILTITSNVVSGILIKFVSVEIIYVVIIFLLILALLLIVFLPIKDTRVIQKNEGFHQKKADEPIFYFIKEKIIKDKKIMIFICLLFLLNLDYGYIPNILPYFMLKYTSQTSPVFLSLLKSSINIGELFASFFVIHYRKKVSKLTKIGLLGSSICFLLLPFSHQMNLVNFIVLSFYGFFDTLTQPLFSYFVSSIDHRNRGKILGIIDCVIYLAAPIGMFLGNFISQYGTMILSFSISIVFVCSYILLVKTKIYKSIDLAGDL